MVVKQAGEKHFTKKFRQGFSHRVILPGRDPEARVKVTDFTGLAGQNFTDVSYPVDETVCVISGHARITDHQGCIEDILAGGTYYVPAGESYDICFIRETNVLCVFSQAADGTLPTDEPDPGE